MGEGVSSELPWDSDLPILSKAPPSKLRSVHGVEASSNAWKMGPKLSSSTVKVPFGVPISKLPLIPGDRWKNGDGRNPIVFFDSEPTQLESRGGDRNGDLLPIDSNTVSGVEAVAVVEGTRAPGEGGGEGGPSSSLS